MGGGSSKGFQKDAEGSAQRAPRWSSRLVQRCR